MDDISSMLDSVLSDPEAMKKISEVASSLSLGGEGENKESKEGFNIDENTLNKLKSASQILGKQDKNVELLKALKPFFSEKRAKKVDDAIKVMGLLRLLPILKDGGLSFLTGGV